MSESVIKYEPRQPVKTRRVLDVLLNTVESRIEQGAPSHVSTEWIRKQVLLAVNRQPSLLRCTQESVVIAVLEAAQLALDISGTLGEAYLVPYKNVCTLIIGYKGFAKLARQTGEVRRIEAEVVYENDRFEYSKGTHLVVRWNPALKDRGEPTGAYALVELKGGGFQAEWISADEIKRIQASSASGKSPAWKQWRDQMWRKTAFRRLSNWLPLSNERWQRALQIDNDDYDMEVEVSEADELNAELGLDEESE